jgi:hypothetical protein
MLRRVWMSLPRLVRFMLTHAANGMVVGCVITFVILWLDLFGLGRLLAGSPLGTFLLFFQMAFTFGAVFMGVAVMRLGREKD